MRYSAYITFPRWSLFGYHPSGAVYTRRAKSHLSQAPAANRRKNIPTGFQWNSKGDSKGIPMGFQGDSNYIPCVPMLSHPFPCFSGLLYAFLASPCFLIEKIIGLQRIPLGINPFLNDFPWNLPKPSNGIPMGFQADTIPQVLDFSRRCSHHGCTTQRTECQEKDAQDPSQMFSTVVLFFLPRGGGEGSCRESSGLQPLNPSQITKNITKHCKFNGFGIRISGQNLATDLVIVVRMCGNHEILSAPQHLNPSHPRPKNAGVV